MPHIKQLLQERQIVRCFIIRNEVNEDGKIKKKKIILSMKCSLVNKGVALKHLHQGFPISAGVVSKEDHGYIMNAGINGVNFFLATRDAGKYDLPLGKTISCVVNTVNEDSRTVSLKIAKSIQHSCPDKPIITTSLPFLAITPGMLFEVVVEQVLQVILPFE